MLVTTHPLDTPAALLPLLPERAAANLMSFVRGGEGLIAFGTAAATTVRGPGRFEQAQAWWADVLGGCEIDDPVSRPGTGPVLFGAFAFADDSGTDSTVVVPEVVIGSRAGEAWLTTVDGAAPRLRDQVAHLLPRVRLSDGAVAEQDWPAVVAQAVERMGAASGPGGEPLQKVVLARQVIAHLDGDLDVRGPLHRLAHAYPDTWVYCVAGMLGATPELLISRLSGRVRSLVLAGTVPHDGTRAGEDHAARELLATPKLLTEHEVAVASVREALTPHLTGAQLHGPFPLPQRAFSHLATDLTGQSRPGANSLELAAALHPSAAVGGRPTAAALPVIAELEQADRGRYAGPVGWMDARGDGEWGIALRGAEMLDERTLRICVGGGIMPDSDPATELAETEAKLAPMRTALDLPSPSPSPQRYA